MQLLGICGSLRRQSYNRALLNAAVELAPANVEITLSSSIGMLPPFDEDIDTEPAPVQVERFRRQIETADGLIIATPEYNYGVPGTLKNAIDWASRPTERSSLYRKPIAIMGAGPTNFGSVRAQLALRQTFLWTDSRVVSRPEVMVFRADERFDNSGRLADAATADRIRGLIAALVSLIESAERPSQPRQR